MTDRTSAWRIEHNNLALRTRIKLMERRTICFLTFS
ncbi:hypothetical protein MM424_003343 [Salmonella enterica]|nr:hypothetical protein [Salmonella enterica]